MNSKDRKTTILFFDLLFLNPPGETPVPQLKRDSPQHHGNLERKSSSTLFSRNSNKLFEKRLFNINQPLKHNRNDEDGSHDSYDVG